MKAGMKIAIVVAVLAGLAALVLWPRGTGSSETEIRTLVARCVSAAEGKQVQVLVDAMAEDFKGPGNASKDGVKTLVTYLLGSQPELVVFNPQLSVTVNGDQADVSGTFIFGRAKVKTAAELAPADVISTYQFDGKLQKVGGKWLFASVNSKQLTP